MASLTFEGDLSGLSEKQQDFIRQVIEKHGFTNNKVVFEPVGKSGDNYVASVKRITVVVNGKDDIKIILKIAPTHETLRSVMYTAGMFNNEIAMYEQVLPKFTTLQASVNIPPSERLKYAKCYGCFSEAPYEMILLEDLTQSGFTILDKFISLDDTSVRLTLKNFAVLHSLSFVLKHLEPDTFEKYKNTLNDVVSAAYQDQQFINTFVDSVKDIATFLDDEHYKKPIQEISSQWLKLFNNAQKFGNPKHMIIQQGDSWTNNIMFKVNDGKAVDLVMIDYQIAKVANPVCDILYMILNCTNHITRSKHYHEWMDYYHEELDKSLSNFGLKANLVYSKDQLDADLKRYSKIFFCFALQVTSMTMRSEDEATKIKEIMRGESVEDIGANMNVNTLSGDTLNYLRSKLIDLVDTYRELGYI